MSTESISTDHKQLTTTISGRTLNEKYANFSKRTKTQNRKEVRLVGNVIESHGLEDYGVYLAFRKVIQKSGHQRAKTSEVAAALGWSAKYLKRQREEKGGFLSPGIQFLYCLTLKS